MLLGGVLTQTLTWRYCMYVNLIFAVVAIVGALRLLSNAHEQVRPQFDIPGILTVSGGLFALVFGFSHAETASWSSPVTLACWPPASSCSSPSRCIQDRVKHPLLPLRVVANRNRGASFLSIGLSGAAMFGVFLFLTYYLQQARGYSPITTGLAFLPMTAVIMATAVTSTTKLRVASAPAGSWSSGCCSVPPEWGS